MTVHQKISTTEFLLIIRVTRSYLFSTADTKPSIKIDQKICISGADRKEATRSKMLGTQIAGE